MGKRAIKQHLNSFNHHGGSCYVLYVYEYTCIYDYICIYWVVPLPSNSGNEGLVRDSLLKMVHNPGGHYYWEGGPPNVSMGYINISVVFRFLPAKCLDTLLKKKLVFRP